MFTFQIIVFDIGGLAFFELSDFVSIGMKAGVVVLIRVVVIVLSKSKKKSKKAKPKGDFGQNNFTVFTIVIAVPAKVSLHLLKSQSTKLVKPHPRLFHS